MAVFEFTYPVQVVELELEEMTEADYIELQDEFIELAA